MIFRPQKVLFFMKENPIVTVLEPTVQGLATPKSAFMMPNIAPKSLLYATAQR